MKISQIAIICLPLISYAQREVIVDKRPDDFKIVHSYTKNDTIQLTYFPNGKLFSSKKAFSKDKPCIYSRYYPNGKPMWERSMLNGIFEGKSVFFDEKGKKVVSINYVNGCGTDTIVHSTKQSVILGNYSYLSRVYGGVENEDGSSNIQETSGFASFYALQLILQPIPDAPNKWKTIELTTDSDGDFMIVLPTQKQNYGIFPSNYCAINITKNLLFPSDELGNSGTTSWSLSQDIKLDWNIPFIYSELKSSSIGYAP